ncbi:MAG TPA: hypothetical protein VK152_10885, partial [Paludibacter sp.]|nr:hypothetical protein [Paludibacter sp.]
VSPKSVGTLFNWAIGISMALIWEPLTPVSFRVPIMVTSFNSVFSERDKLYISTYLGDDVIYSNIREGYQDNNSSITEDRMKMGWNWGNLITAARWNHVVNNKLFMDASATYTRYRFDMNVGMSQKHTGKNSTSYSYASETLGYQSGIQDYAAKVDFDYSPNPNNDIKFGASYTNHTFRPGVERFKENYENDSTKVVNDTIIGNQNMLAHETALYFEDNVSIGQVLKANFGLHYSTFYVQGRFYQSPQPRASMRALLSDNLSVKAGYAMMTQYIHLLSNSNISLPTDLWVPATKKVTPMRSHQYSVGVFYNLNNLVDFSVESYYKSMHNLIEYKPGASFMNSNTGWEQKVYSGEGWSYGVEFLAQKSVGKTTGWVGYTWSKSERRFNRPGQEINDGLVFPAKFDRRHDVSIVVSHKFSEKIDASATWVYSTGNCGTLGLQNYSSYPIDGSFIDFNNLANQFFYPATSVPYIEKRNNYRLPDYHRLDLSVNFHKQLKHGVRTWNISVYNAYNQMNPFLVYLKTNYSYSETGLSQTWKSLNKLTLFPIIPSVSYSYKF